MPANATDLFLMTAGDLMTANVIQLPESMSLRAAAQELLKVGASGAPVVNADGECVGVLSPTDFLRLVARRQEATQPTGHTLPKSRQFQTPHHDSADPTRTPCTLPPGSGSDQAQTKTSAGDDILGCNQPHCVFTDWQMVETENLPIDEVRLYMTRDPVTVTADTPIQVLARQMIDAHIHRLIVLDELNQPVGVVTSTDILAAVSYAEASA